MRKIGFVLALSCVGWAVSGPASAERLTASDCRPLSGANAEACCAAANWEMLVRPQDVNLCRTRLNQTAPTALGTPPDSSTPDNPDNPTDDTVDRGINNGFGNGNQDAPGQSGPNNNAENDPDQRSNPSSSENSAN